jgi:hypothetical protein
MSRLHDIKTGKLQPTKATFKESRNDKESLWDRLRAFLKRDGKNV